MLCDNPERGPLLDVFAVMRGGAVVGFMVDGMCKTSLGIVLKPLMAIFGMKDQAERIQEAFKSGDPVEITVSIVEMFCMLFGLTSQCFTGDTLVSTESGLRPIEDIQAGDYVWSENTETGEKELKKVLAVSVTETDMLVHVTTQTGTVINTTENHPFYTEGKGWCVASELEEGDVLRTQDGKTETVASVETETLDEPVKVYNLEIEDSHTYYVSADGVLVHNACGDSKKLRDDMNSKGKTPPADGNKYAAHHIVASSSPNAQEARDILDLVDIGYNDSMKRSTC